MVRRESSSCTGLRHAGCVQRPDSRQDYAIHQVTHSSGIRNLGDPAGLATSLTITTLSGARTTDAWVGQHQLRHLAEEDLIGQEYPMGYFRGSFWAWLAERQLSSYQSFEKVTIVSEDCQGRRTFRALWGALAAAAAGLGAFTAFAVAADGSESSVARVVSGVLTLTFVWLTIRLLTWRVTVDGGVVKIHGVISTRSVNVCSVEPMAADEKLFWIAWVPGVTAEEESERVPLWSLAGYSLSQTKPNRRVARVCAEIQALSTKGAP